MLSGSAILRVVLLLAASVGLVALASLYWSHDGGLPEAPLTNTPAAPSASEPRRAEAPPPQPAPEPPPTPAPPPAPPQPEAPVVREAPPPPEASEPAPEAPVVAAQENAGPRAENLVDLNSATLAELNNLKAGKSIGRAIIQHRPYTSVDQLLSKRVLSRATYQRIKDQVTVR